MAAWYPSSSCTYLSCGASRTIALRTIASRKIGSREIAATVAERIQVALEHAAADIDGRLIGATVSTGMAFSSHGAFELPVAAKALAATGHHAVICLGLVLRGLSGLPVMLRVSETDPPS